MSNELYKTGQEAPKSSYYVFVSYTDGSTLPAPTKEEKEIYLTRGEVFPPIRSQNKGAIWKAK
ncbi:YjzC family protein [Herpetosiphon gulosus]|uniref:YjzC family protein n=1 Tax=Herpetosiphon gulosus TaxID=1973496 RepID=A0ABP9X070_9CHLR